MNLPKARTENLVEQNLEKETLIYDLLIDKAFNLNETSTIVYKACNGATTFEELKRKHKFSDEFIYLALDELKRNDLLVKEAVYVSPFANTNRREVIKKVGLASMFVLPIISGLVAPKAINAASNTAPNAATGGYGQSCLGGCIQGNNVRTTCVSDTCCSYGSDNTRPDGSSFEVETCGFPTDDCSGMASRQCCSGSASGTCTVLHSPDDLNEDGLTQCSFTQGGEQYSQYSYRLSCSCTCDTYSLNFE